jgi:hypothetical protein
MKYRASTTRTLRLVPTSQTLAGPQVCLAVLEDARRGILTAQWFSLSGSLEQLVSAVGELQSRGVTTTQGSIGIFDFEDIDVDVIRGEPTLAHLHRVGSARVTRH